MKFKDIRVPHGMKFKDITGERRRTYYYSNGAKFNVEDPIALHVSASGGHRIVTATGWSVYVAPGWVAFEFNAAGSRLNWRF